MDNNENYEFLTIEFYYSQLGFVGNKKTIELPIVKSEYILKVEKIDSLKEVGVISIKTSGIESSQKIKYLAYDNRLYREYGDLETNNPYPFSNIEKEIEKNYKLPIQERINLTNYAYAKIGINFNSGFLFNYSEKNKNIIEEDNFTRINPEMFLNEKVSNLYERPPVSRINLNLLITREKAIKDLKNLFKNAVINKEKKIFIETTPFAFVDYHLDDEKITAKSNYNDFILNPNNLLNIGEINRRKSFLEIHKHTPLLKPTKTLNKTNRHHIIEYNSVKGKNNNHKYKDFICYFSEDYKDLMEPKEWLDTYFNIYSYLNILKRKVEKEIVFLNSDTVKNISKQVSDLIEDFSENFDNRLLKKIEVFINNTLEDSKHPKFWHPSLKWTTMYEDQSEITNFLSINSDGKGMSSFLSHEISRLNTIFSPESEASLFDPDMGKNHIRRQKILFLTCLENINKQIIKARLEYGTLLTNSNEKVDKIIDKPEEKVDDLYQDLPDFKF